MFGIEHICRILDIPDLNRLPCAIYRPDHSGHTFAFNLTVKRSLNLRLLGEGLWSFLVASNLKEGGEEILLCESGPGASWADSGSSEGKTHLSICSGALSYLSLTLIEIYRELPFRRCAMGGRQKKSAGVFTDQ